MPAAIKRNVDGRKNRFLIAGAAPRKLRKFRRLVRHVRSPGVILLAADMYVPLIASRISAGGPKRPVSAVLENLQSWFLGAVRRTNLVQAPGPQLRRTSPCCKSEEETSF